MKKHFPVILPEGYVDFFKKLETWQNEQQIKLKKKLFTSRNRCFKTAD